MVSGRPGERARAFGRSAKGAPAPRARKTSRARPAAALIIGSMFRLAVSLSPVAAGALSAALAWAKPGGERG